MLFRPHFWGIIALVLVFLSGEAGTQAPTDLSAWKNPQNAENVSTLASRMLNNLRNATGTAREESLASTLTALKEIAADDEVVPSTRYNAILAAGQLVSVEQSPGVLPVAYSDALPYLIEVYQEPDTPHYLKYGALLGIVRHTNSSGFDPDRKDTVIDLFLDTVMTEFVPGIVTLDSVPLEPAVWEWFRHTALDGLTALKTVGTDNEVVTELLELINRKSQELEELTELEITLTRAGWEQSHHAANLASKTAKTLGDLKYAEATDIDTEAITDAFFRLTRAVCDINAKMIADSIEQGGNSPNPTLLLERIVINVKMGTHSVVWGVRNSLLTGRATEDSFYASLEPDDPARKRLDVLMAEIIKLSTFLDEGDGARRPIENMPKAFFFNLTELRDALAKTSEALNEEEKPEWSEAQ